MKVFLLLSIFIILLSMVGLKIIHNIFSNKDYYNILQIFLIGITINILIFIFLKLIFNNYEIKKGVKGHVGLMGNKGLMGKPDYCASCNVIKKTLGSEKIKKDKNKIIVQTPVISYDVKGEPII